MFDIKLLRKFRKRFYFEYVEEDILSKYKVKNIVDDDESYVYICNALFNDYILGRANYKAYIEDGMDARMLMDLRKNALLRWGNGVDEDFFKSFEGCEVWQDSRRIRVDWIRRLCHHQYCDFDWQYYYYLLLIYPEFKRDWIEFNFEYCYEDADMSKCSSIEDYKADFIFAHFGFSREWRNSPVQFSGRSIFEDTPDIVPTVEVDKRMFWADLFPRDVVEGKSVD